MTRHIAKANSSQDYVRLVSDVQGILSAARRQAAQTVNRLLTACYWEIGRRIVDFEQRGRRRAAYGDALLKRLSEDLTLRLGRGFSVDNLEMMRRFYEGWPPARISETLSRKSAPAEEETLTPSLKIDHSALAQALPLSWSHYVRLMGIDNPYARDFYETEALRGGWSTRQLDRQIGSQFYERTALSRNKASMLANGACPSAGDAAAPEGEIKDPYVLEFLGLKDEYSESDLENALIAHLESFLLELGGDFAFVARQKRLRVGGQWYRVDLVLYHRRLRCLILVDLKLDRFTHADAGQMHLYLNYARKHWTLAGENPPVGLILCAKKDHAVAHYALEGLPNTVLASEYRTALPDEHKLANELERTRLTLDARAGRKRPPK